MKIEKMEIKKKNLKTLREEVNMMITIFRAKIQEHSQRFKKRSRR